MAVKKTKTRLAPTSVRLYGSAQERLGVINDDWVLTNIINTMIIENLDEYIETRLSPFATRKECRRIQSEYEAIKAEELEYEMLDDEADDTPDSQEAEMPGEKAEV